MLRRRSGPASIIVAHKQTKCVGPCVHRSGLDKDKCFGCSAPAFSFSDMDLVVWR
jgi:hypothetical protein